VAAAGNLDHAEVVRRVRETALGVGPEAEPVGYRRPIRPVPVQPAGVTVRDKDTEQAHLVLGGAGLGSAPTSARFALGVLNNALGGGMSSRLFQEIRERRGLAYSVYSYTTQYADSGTFAVYAGCAPGKVDEVLALSRAGACPGGPRRADRGGGGPRPGMVKGGLSWAGGNRLPMSRLGKSELLYPRLLSVDELLAWSTG